MLSGGDDPVAFLQFLHHLFVFFHLFLLGADENKVKMAKMASIITRLDIPPPAPLHLPALPLHMLFR